MVAARNNRRGARPKRRPRPEALMLVPRRRRGDDPTIAFEWYDGAGELHHHELSPAQSWPYLHPTR